ncbi:uncharacterized protein L969DRAFT_16749 [Mixia osmundae IAM 14324]|uniref:peptidylprolyl isomerase n=1 Tax=Mixia osmundae (strain CBS 9802 / IAM 14324 / JCM 22182 / KY 12970) TaxID=764103 RepID=G7E9X2_MIXOS|nr:uncharacterized protein L969DRAFT_16749 [Mixia osmundae IAM 14324]KEI40075.1 hypothetical protein L969DRAFT_16749 [Mixia osmundae IAM 14324]GAA99441.1 hypothetical protein E5Q_06140 [Mixia osmundae IAM 14324]
MVNPRVFLDLSIGDEPAGRVVAELFIDSVPKTVENFRCLCTGEKGVSASTGRAYHYKGTRLHRIVAGFMILGGDTSVKGNGSGGESVYDERTFDDEDLSRPIDQAGLLVMANRGPNTNASQFFITVEAAEHLNGKHVVFGRLVAGLAIVQKVSELPVGPKNTPLESVTVTHCGELELRKVVVPRTSPSRARDSRSRSLTPSDDDKARKERKRKPRHHSSDHRKSRHRSSKPAGAEDAERKERDEQARTAEVAARERADREAEDKRRQRARELAELKNRFGDDLAKGPADASGVRYKGRGAMRYGSSQSGMRSY